MAEAWEGDATECKTTCESPQERQQVHSLIDLLPPTKLGAIRNLLEVFLDEDCDTLSPAEAKAISEADEWLKHNEPIPHEEVLAEFGLSVADWEKLSGQE